MLKNLDSLKIKMILELIKTYDLFSKAACKGLLLSFASTNFIIIRLDKIILILVKTAFIKQSKRDL